MQLTVLFDPSCELCIRATRWLRQQPAFVPIKLTPAGSSEIERRFPGLEASSTLESFTVVANDGRVWRGAKAWVMCLWALKDYRGWALRLGHPDRMPWAKRWIDRVSSNRHRISAWLGSDTRRGEGTL